MQGFSKNDQKLYSNAKKPQKYNKYGYYTDKKLFSEFEISLFINELNIIKQDFHWTPGYSIKNYSLNIGN